ncbi:hypothetical protein H6G89_22005 [Oscillatoria sp. FACHB-1407]|uniref:hypothetical protein n=1 Tax=Oscillatoria sp. FACHB-1407 TaxID=2692847 RepID=UPI001689FB57|nr:hypothetical protein [Oscillatoria sp. FACHB-1407]MBD2463678.1 hypothetical protein [Oscillatoria sp. FACHB-1407]
MTQNLLMTPKASSACATRSCCLLQYGYIGFRFVRYKCSPWFVLVIAPFKLFLTSGVERTRVQVRYFSAIARIDFVGVYRFLQDLLW